MGTSGRKAARPRIAIKLQEKWVPRVITAHSGPLSYKVSVTPNTVWRQHINQPKETVAGLSITNAAHHS